LTRKTPKEKSREVERKMGRKLKLKMTHFPDPIERTLENTATKPHKQRVKKTSKYLRLSIDTQAV
jgi:hypothetical protein